MKLRIQYLIALQAIILTGLVADDFGFLSLPEDVQGRLKNGEAVVLDRRPDEPDEVDKRFVTVAELVTGSRAEIWNVIADKEGAEFFLNGVLASKVIEESEDFIVVEQETAVGGPQGSYEYVLRHELTPMEKIDFSFVRGEIENVEGGWWIYDCPVEEKQLVAYALHVDPGGFAPQIIVKSGLKKSMPGTISSIQREVLRRRTTGASAGE